MFSGKTEELLRRVRRAEIAQQHVQIFKPAVDTRYGETNVQTHNGRYAHAKNIAHAADIPAHIKPETTVVAIDEVQFFDPPVVNVALTLASQHYRVIVAGLDMDFRGEPFGVMPQLMALAEEVVKLNAICTVCGELASHSQRLVNGQPANYHDPIILVGATERYEARCRKHHSVPGSPHNPTA